jgi:predicted nucleic acid-binding protein
VIVLDASATVEWLLRTPTGERVDARLAVPGETWHAPHLLDVEVLQVLRRFVAARAMTWARARAALQDMLDMPITRYPHDALLARAWALRDNLIAYDAVYVVLAEALAAPLITCDGKLSAAPGHTAQIELVQA